MFCWFSAIFHDYKSFLKVEVLSMLLISWHFHENRLFMRFHLHWICGYVYIFFHFNTWTSLEMFCLFFFSSFFIFHHHNLFFITRPILVRHFMLDWFSLPAGDGWLSQCWVEKPSTGFWLSLVMKRHIFEVQFQLMF